MRLESVAIPTESTIGQPFWTLFELDTGAPAGHKQDGETFGVLFFSKKQAESYFISRSYNSEWAVRGLSQENLRTYILTVDSMAGRFLLVQSTSNFTEPFPFVAQEIDRQALISEFYVGKGCIPDKPMVMPSIAKGRNTTS
jgi:hypothetical protein